MSQEPRTEFERLRDEAAHEWRNKGCVEGQEIFFNSRTMYAGVDFKAGADWSRDYWLEQVRVLTEALEFYASLYVWGNGAAEIDPCDQYKCEFGTMRGGIRAKEALTKWAELSKPSEG